MGGHGSGRLWHYGAKDTVEDYRSLDIRRLKKAKVLFDGNYFNWMWSRNGKEISSISMSVHGSRIDLNYKARINGGIAINSPTAANVKLTTTAWHVGRIG